MNITEARKRCDELRQEISRIRKESDFDGFAKYMGRLESKPLEEELDYLMMAIIKADETTEIDLGKEVKNEPNKM